MKPEYLNTEQAKEVQLFLQENHEKVAHLVTADAGTCVLGNGITVKVVPKGKRKATNQMVFRNIWTQAEQELPLLTLIKMARKEYPEWAHLIQYDCGRMD